MAVSPTLHPPSIHLCRAPLHVKGDGLIVSKLLFSLAVLAFAAKQLPVSGPPFHSAPSPPLHTPLCCLCARWLKACPGTSWTLPSSSKDTLTGMHASGHLHAKHLSWSAGTSLYDYLTCRLTKQQHAFFNVLSNLPSCTKLL